MDLDENFSKQRLLELEKVRAPSGASASGVPEPLAETFGDSLFGE